MTPTSSVRVPTSRVPTTVPTNVLCRASLPASSMYPMCTVPYRLTDNPFHAYIISLCSDRCIISTFSTLSVGSRGKLDCAGRGVQYPGEYYWFLPVSACAFLERRLRRASGGSAPTPPLGLTAPNPIVYVCTPERTTVLRKSLPLKVLPYRKRPLNSSSIVRVAVNNSFGGCPVLHWCPKACQRCPKVIRAQTSASRPRPPAGPRISGSINKDNIPGGDSRLMILSRQITSQGTSLALHLYEK